MARKVKENAEVAEPSKQVVLLETVNSEAPKKSFEVAGEEKTPRPRLSVNLKDDGTFDWDSMRDASRDKLLAALQQDMRARSIVVGVSEQDAPPLLLFDKRTIGALYDGLGGLETMLFTWRGIPRHIAAHVFPYTDQEKDFLYEPTSKVISKHAPDVLVKFQDEFALGLVLFQVTSMKLQTAQQLMKEERERGPVVQPVNGHDQKFEPQIPGPISDGEPIR
jgi:hypothetical protein